MPKNQMDRLEKVAEEIELQQIEAETAVAELLKNDADVQGRVNSAARVFRGVENFEGRELVLVALNVLNAQLGIAKMRRYQQSLQNSGMNDVQTDCLTPTT